MFGGAGENRGDSRQSRDGGASRRDAGGEPDAAAVGGGGGLCAGPRGVRDAGHRGDGHGGDGSALGGNERRPEDGELREALNKSRRSLTVLIPSCGVKVLST